MRVISALVGTLLAAVLGGIFFCIAYAGLHWFEFRSTELFDALNADLVGRLKLLWNEISQRGTIRRIGIAAAIALLAMIALMTALFFALKKRHTTDARFLNLLEAKALEHHALNTSAIKDRALSSLGSRKPLTGIAAIVTMGAAPDVLKALLARHRPDRM